MKEIGEAIAHEELGVFTLEVDEPDSDNEDDEHNDDEKKEELENNSESNDNKDNNKSIPHLNRSKD